MNGSVGKFSFKQHVPMLSNCLSFLVKVVNKSGFMRTASYPLPKLFARNIILHAITSNLTTCISKNIIAKKKKRSKDFFQSKTEGNPKSNTYGEIVI